MLLVRARFVANVLATHSEQMLRVFHKSLHVIEAALKAEMVVRSNGQLINVGRDHDIRLTAAELALDMIHKVDWQQWLIPNQGAEPEKPEHWLLAGIEPVRWPSRSCTHRGPLS